MKKHLLLILVLLFISCSKKESTVYNITSEVSPAEGGSISPSSGTFEEGVEVTVSAIPSKGYYFKNWSGGISGTDNPYSFTIKSDTQVTAVFEEEDEDGDGISDGLDQCPGTPTGENVNSEGCADSQNDADGDSVSDDVDLCPDTPISEAVDADGCSESQKDTDGDGVTNNLDQCQNTPAGETVDSEGCSATQTDTDGDTITDDFDQCPNTPPGETVDSDGCSDGQKDTDEDSVTDDLDLCPNTNSGDSVDADGCADSQKDTDGDGVTDDIDQCADTPSGESVDAIGCSPSQSDKTAPVVTDITTIEITSNSFTVDWSLDEGSKGYIQFGTSPGVYVASTGIENNFLDRHVQLVGGSNPFLLNPGTTYYWQIYVEDQYGNSGFTDEIITTTIEELTYVPDDYFEQALIDFGYDDVLDDYVLTSNIETVQVLELPFVTFMNGPIGVIDLTGIEDFTDLVEYKNNGNPVNNFDFTNNLNLKKLFLDGHGLAYLSASLDISQNTKLESLIISYYPIGAVLDLSPNINLKYLSVGEGGAEQYTLDKNIALETLSLVWTGGGFLDLTKNINLKSVAMTNVSVSGINIKNGFNTNIEQFSVDIDGCIQVDDVDYSNNNWSGTGTFSEDCGY